MAFWNTYPYTDFHELNLDWVIKKIQEATSASGIFFDDQISLGADNVQDAIVALDNLILQVASQSTKFELIENAIPESYWENGHTYTHLQTVNDPTLTAIIDGVRNDKFIAFKRAAVVGSDNIEKLYLEQVVDEKPADYAHTVFFKNPLTNEGMSLTINGLDDSDNIFVELNPDVSIHNVSTFNGRVGDVNPESGDYASEQIDFTDASFTASNVKDAIIEVNTKIPANIVQSFNGRSDNVSPISGDYDAEQITYDNTQSGLQASDVQAAIDEIIGSVLSAGVASFNGRVGVVNPANHDYDASQIDIDTGTGHNSLPNTLTSVQDFLDWAYPDTVTVTLTLNGAKEDTINIYESGTSQLVGTCIFASGQTSGTCHVSVPNGGGTYDFVSNVAKDPSNLANDYAKTITISDTLTQTLDIFPTGSFYWYGNEFTSITGGWNAVRELNGGTVTKNTNNFFLNCITHPSESSQAYIEPTNITDFSVHTKVTVIINSSAPTASSYPASSRGIIIATGVNQTGTMLGYIRSEVTYLTAIETTLDTSEYNTGYLSLYNFVGVGRPTATAYIYAVIVE